MEKITIVTGGSRGIGAATARACAADGQGVCVAYQSSAEAAQAVVSAIEDAGGRAIAIRADMTCETDIAGLFDQVDERLGPVTGLVNNAGIHGPRGRLDALAASEIESVLRTNVMGYFLCAREAVKRMSTRTGGKGGAIVNVSSGSATSGAPGEGVLYAASKGAVNSLTIGLAQEVGAEGIRVNAVSPGITRTDMPPRNKIDNAVATVPMGRAGGADEIAQAILWLLSDAASYTSAAILRVGGGRP
jgi:NAD(P)-dependent dehydrogenase (short-subunit alcohol dehydrogenase family)